MRGVRAAGFRFLPPAPFRPVHMWPHARPRPLGVPRQLGRPPSPLAPVSRTRGALVVCFGGVSDLSSSAAVTCCGCGGAAILGPPISSSSLPPSPCTPVARVVGGGVSPPRPRPSSLGALAPLVVPLGVSSPGETQSLRGCCCLVATRLPCPLPGGTPVGFLSLRRPRGLPPCLSLWGTCGPLRRPHGPRCCPTLPRCCRPDFSACLLVSPFVPALPHGGPAFPPRWRPQGGISRFRPRWPALPHVAAPRLFLVCPTPLPSVSTFPTPPPLW